MGWLADRDKARERLKRRGAPIRAYCGPNGGGKSWTLIYDAIPSLRYGRRVLSTVRILDFDNPRECDDDACTYPGHEYGHPAAHPLYVPFTDYRQLIDWRDGDVLMDEVTGIASSRESLGGMPVQVANYLVQLRRRNVSLSWSTPAWGRADKIIRECTQAVSICMGYIPKRRPTPEGEAPRLWSDKRGFYVRTYDAMLMDEFDAGSIADVPHIGAAFYWRPGSLAERAYDTLDPVSQLSHVTESGMCMHCGGNRARPKCDCAERTRGKRERGAGGAVPQAGDPAPAALALVLDAAHDRALADELALTADAL